MMASFPKYYKIHTKGCKVELEPIYSKLSQVVHAHWIINGEWAECSNCHEDEKITVLAHKDSCPACGAIMDEESVVIVCDD